ncbi:MAG: DUF3795 domain-containing protein [Promethearchaeota archaeon]|nr:MAG: DUF3795 domain-containing protein [Candidatus Lokiarchaeota archaeon]
MKNQSAGISKQIIGVCGLICSNCKIYSAPNNPIIAGRLVEHFQGMWENVKAEDFHCGTCRGDLSENWSPDCWIRKCCISEKRLKYCSECSDFPCSKLKDWTKENKGYEEALERLKKMNKNIVS